MDRTHRNKPLLQHVTQPFPEMSEKEMYEKRYKAMMDSKKPKKPPKMNRDLVFEKETPKSVSRSQEIPSPVNLDQIFVSSQ
jgi:hypothetical protein